MRLGGFNRGGTVFVEPQTLFVCEVKFECSEDNKRDVKWYNVLNQLWAQETERGIPL